MRAAVVLVAVASLAALFACKADTPVAPVAELTPVASNAPAPLSPRIDASASPPPAASAGPATETCQADADCILSTFPGCCVCCPCGPLRAMTASHEAALRHACERKDCRSCQGFEGRCTACVDPAKEGMRARCIDATCTLVETSAPGAPATPGATVACKTDDDCWLDDQRMPIARPAKLRGKRIRPCTDSEHAPACREGVCMVRHFKC